MGVEGHEKAKVVLGGFVLTTGLMGRGTEPEKIYVRVEHGETDLVLGIDKEQAEKIAADIIGLAAKLVKSEN